jgi:hypothetical protein
MFSAAAAAVVVVDAFLQEIIHAVPSSPELKRRAPVEPAAATVPATASVGGVDKKDERLRKRRTSVPDALAGATAEDLARIEEEKRERRREKDRIRKRIQRERQRREKMERLSRAQQSGLSVDTDCSMPELDLTVCASSVPLLLPSTDRLSAGCWTPAALSSSSSSSSSSLDTG